MRIKIVILLLAFAAATFTGCGPDPDPIEPQEVQNINFDVSILANGKNVTWVDSAYTLPSNEDVTLSRLAFILSDFVLIKSDGGEVVLDSQYVLVNPKFDEPKFTLNNVPQGDYTSIKFNLGLDSSVNYGNPNQYEIDHPLSPSRNALHWNWTGGYIFMSIEGRLADTTNKGFVFHLAGSSNLTSYTLPFSTSKGIEAKTAELSLNVDEIFQNPEVYSLANDGMSTHSVSDPVSQKLFGNMTDIFSISVK